MKSLRIAQVAPLFESVPPKLYGGTERVVSNLTEALVARGHEVTLFASGDSTTRARLIAGTDEPLRFLGTRETHAPHLVMFERVRALSHEFDIVHFHNEYLQFPLARQMNLDRSSSRSLAPVTVSTLHGRLDLPEYQELFDEFDEIPLVAISNSQRQAKPHQHWVGTVHHGLPDDTIKFAPSGGSYLAFIGRISPEKGVEEAIEIARRSGLLLKIAAKIESSNFDYYLRLKDDLTSSGIEYVGEIAECEKSSFIGGARALLFPISWPEPFGLVMIEALAAGTPVIAFRNGSVGEIIQHGKTGLIVDCVDDAIDAVARIGAISRGVCRADFERRFTVSRMTDDYLRIFHRLIELRFDRTEEVQIWNTRSH